MNLLTAALIVSGVIGLCALLPLRFQTVRNYSKFLLIIGSVVLLGFCVFDLIPETYEMGGIWSLVIMGASWALFAGIHLFQNHDHAHPDEPHTHHEDLHRHNEGSQGMASHSVSFLLGSMALHCFAGGMLLVTSYEVSERLAYHVFLGLVGHKAFEAISVASLLIEKARSRKHLLACVSLYALSFPLGVAFTWGADALLAGSLGKESIETIAMAITSVAVGSLLGCLLQDFLVPSIQQMRTRFARVGQPS